MSGTKNSKGRGGSAGRPPGKGGNKNVVSAARRPTQSGRGTVIAAVGIIVVLVVVIGGIVWQRSQTSTINAGYGSAKTAPVSVSDGTVTVGKSSAPVTLDAYEDFLCPVCGEFEKTYGQQIAKALDDGKIKMRYHTLDFLNSDSASGDYSARAAGAALCVAADGDGSKYPAFHSALFDPKNQPKERSSSDLSNDDMAKIAGDVGASKDAQSCIAGGKKTAAASTTAAAAAKKLGDIVGPKNVGTPTILNGTTKVDINDRSWLSSLA